MDRDVLYYHFANLGLVLLGLFSVQGIMNRFVLMIVMVGVIAGFIVSWQLTNRRFQYMELFIGMLSLAAVVIMFGRLVTTAITFENLLRIFSTALVWLTLFQSFGLESGKSYAMLQFISVCLLISSVGMALEQEIFYIVILALFLLLFIFTMRLDLLCEKKRKGSMIIGDPREVMSLWQQIKVGAIMFSFVLIISSVLYPFVPRFENLSLRWIPSTLLGIPEKTPLLKLLKEAPKTIKDNKKIKKEQLVDDDSKKRETGGRVIGVQDKIKKETEEKIDRDKIRRVPAKAFSNDIKIKVVEPAESDNKKTEEKTEEKVDRNKINSVPAKALNKDIDISEVESLEVKADRSTVPLDSSCKLEAELKMKDGSTLPATRLVDWKVVGSDDFKIDNDGNFTPKETGTVEISASYKETFDKDVDISEVESLEVKADRSTVPLDSSCKLEAELKMKDGSTLPATRLVDWKVVGSDDFKIDNRGNFTPKETGTVEISASYLGAFSNDIKIKVVEPVESDNKKIDRDKIDRVPAKTFNKDIDIFKIESLTVKADRSTVPLDSSCKLEAELKMKDGSTLPATRLVDWKVVGSDDFKIDNDGNFTPKETGTVEISASYLGTFSNDIKIQSVKPVEPVKKKSKLSYLFMLLFWFLMLALSALIFWIFMKSRRLYEMALKRPREFIKEVYLILCRGFKFYGVPRFDYIAFREFFESAKALMALKSEPMRLITEGVLEARFSTHDISVEHSQKTLGLFHEIKEVILERENRKEIWKKALFVIFLMEILLMPKDIKKV